MLAGRGDVFVALSNPGARSRSKFEYSNGVPLEAVAEKMLQVAQTRSSLPRAALIELLCRHFHLAPFRFGPDATWPGNEPIGNHGKFWMVDDRYFYIGSDNLYPVDLREFGYILDDRAAAAELRRDYWDPLWRWSRHESRPRQVSRRERGTLVRVPISEVAPGEPPGESLAPNSRRRRIERGDASNCSFIIPAKAKVQTPPARSAAEGSKRRGDNGGVEEPLMPLMSGKRAFLELLRQEGVEVIFGNPGTTELPLMDALAVETAPRYVLGLQEGAVMAMAGGYAQASGRLTAVNIHVAPGLGNAIGMLYDAQKAGAPILVTAGQHDQSFALTEPILWAELPEIARPFVKWSVEVRRLADLPRLLHRAAKTALAPPTGPVFLSIPGDILNAEADIDLGRPTRIAPRLRGDAAAIAAAAKLLAAAKHPLILAGDSVAQSNALAALVKLAEAIGAPVHLEGIDNSTPFPSTHPLFRGPITRLAPQIRKTLDQHDLLLSIGGDLLTMSLPSEVEAIPPGLPIIHLDSDPWQLGKNYPAEVAILADPKAALPELTQAAAAAMSDAAKNEAERRRIKLGAAIATERAALKARALAEAGNVRTQPLALWQVIGEMLPKDIVIVEETLSSGPGLRQLIAGEDSKSFFGMRGGGIGWGLPAAVGVKLALPDRPVLALIGDGSAMFNCQALWTAARERLNVIFLILNNGAYRILKQRVNALRGHAAQTGRYVAMDLDDPPIDFIALARSMGVRAERASSLNEVRKALAAALAAECPTLIDVTLDPSFSPI